MSDVDWSHWTLILLKPDCMARGLAAEVIGCLNDVVQIVDTRICIPSERQIFAHYEDLLSRSRELGRDVPSELRRIYVGRRVGIALGHGADAAARVRAILGHSDPAKAETGTIRGRFSVDSLSKAMAEGRLVDNIIHSSDDVAAVAREFDIWYGASDAGRLLRCSAVRECDGHDA